MATASVDLQGATPKTDLTLSEVTGLLPEDARTSAAITIRLEAIERLRAAGDDVNAAILTDDLITFVWGPGGLPPESERRALWGDR